MVAAHLLGFRQGREDNYTPCWRRKKRHREWMPVVHKTAVLWKVGGVGEEWGNFLGEEGIGEREPCDCGGVRCFFFWVSPRRWNVLG